MTIYALEFFALTLGLALDPIAIVIVIAGALISRWAWWSPWIAGLAIGALQIAASQASAGGALGASSTITAAVIAAYAVFSLAVAIRAAVNISDSRSTPR